MSNFVSIGMRKAPFYQATAGRAVNGSRPLISCKVLPVKCYRLHHQRFSSQSRIARELSWRSDFIECAPQSRERGFWSRIDPRCLVPAFGGKADIKVKRT